MNNKKYLTILMSLGVTAQSTPSYAFDLFSFFEKTTGEPEVDIGKMTKNIEFKINNKNLSGDMSSYILNPKITNGYTNGIGTTLRDSIKVGNKIIAVGETWYDYYTPIGVIVVFNENQEIERYIELPKENVDCVCLNSIEQTSDGGFIISQRVKIDERDSYSRPSLLKLDKDFNKLWEYMDENTYMTYYSAIETLDGGFIAVGYYSSSSYVSKFSSTGELIKTVTINEYGNSKEEIKLIDIVATQDNGYIAIGKSLQDGYDESHVTKSGDKDGILYKLDSELNIVNKKLLGNNDTFDEFQRIIKNSSNNYVLVGTEGGVNYKEDSKKASNVWIVEVDKDLNINWENTCSDEFNAIGVDIKEVQGGGYILGSNNATKDVGGITGHGNFVGKYTKVDSNGKIIWEYSPFERNRRLDDYELYTINTFENENIAGFGTANPNYTGLQQGGLVQYLNIDTYSSDTNIEVEEFEMDSSIVENMPSQKEYISLANGKGLIRSEYDNITKKDLILLDSEGQLLWDYKFTQNEDFNNYTDLGDDDEFSSEVHAVLEDENYLISVVEGEIRTNITDTGYSLDRLGIMIIKHDINTGEVVDRVEFSDGSYYISSIEDLIKVNDKYVLYNSNTVYVLNSDLTLLRKEEISSEMRLFSMYKTDNHVIVTHVDSSYRNSTIEKYSLDGQLISSKILSNEGAIDNVLEHNGDIILFAGSNSNNTIIRLDKDFNILYNEIIYNSNNDYDEEPPKLSYFYNIIVDDYLISSSPNTWSGPNQNNITVVDLYNGKVVYHNISFPNSIITHKEDDYYLAIDFSENTVSKIRTINHPPLVTMGGQSAIEIGLGEEFNPDDYKNFFRIYDFEETNIAENVDVIKHKLNNVNINKPGKYFAEYEVKDSSGGLCVIRVDVIVVENPTVINNAPVIDASDKTIVQGTEFNPRLDVSATDIEDGDLTEDIEIIEDTVDETTPGEYRVVYKVSDKEGLSATKPITVTVIEAQIEDDNENNDEGDIGNGNGSGNGDSAGGEDIPEDDNSNENDNNNDNNESGNGGNPGNEETVNTPPVITAHDIEITKGQYFDIMTGVTANDVEDGDITKNIKVIKNDLNINVVGEYEVVYEVEDSKGVKVNHSRTITVKESEEPINTVPTINANDLIVERDSENFDPMLNVTAEDAEDGDLTKDIEIIENTVDLSKSGVYVITYKVEDSKGAVVKRSVSVKVYHKEEDVPVLLLKEESVKLELNAPFDPLDYIMANDNLDGNITSSIEILENTVNTAVLGKYKVRYGVRNSVGLYSEKTLEVIVGDYKEDSSNTEDNNNTGDNSNTENNNGSNDNSNNNTSKPQTGDNLVDSLLLFGISTLGLISVNKRKSEDDIK